MRVLKPGRKYYQVIIMKAYMMANKAQTYDNTIFTIRIHFEFYRLDIFNTLFITEFHLNIEG